MCRERERKRADARAREGELEQRLRALHTLETQLEVSAGGGVGGWVVVVMCV
jgi:hypothetical protein